MYRINDLYTIKFLWIKLYANMLFSNTLKLVGTDF